MAASGAVLSSHHHGTAAAAAEIISGGNPWFDLREPRHVGQGEAAKISASAARMKC
jgi:hypothetical protein